MANATTTTAMIRTPVAICAWVRISEMFCIYGEYNELTIVCLDMNIYA